MQNDLDIIDGFVRIDGKSWVLSQIKKVGAAPDPPIGVYGWPCTALLLVPFGVLGASRTAEVLFLSALILGCILMFRKAWRRRKESKVWIKIEQRPIEIYRWATFQEAESVRQQIEAAIGRTSGEMVCESLGQTMCDAPPLAIVGSEEPSEFLGTQNDAARNGSVDIVA